MPDTPPDTSTMTNDEPRRGEVRVNDTDLKYLKLASEELPFDVPLGRVAREGAKRIIGDEPDDDTGVRL